MTTVFLVQHQYDLEDSFEVFAAKTRAVAYAKRLAEEDAQEVRDGRVVQVDLGKYWSDTCDVEEGAYMRSVGDVWIRVVEVPFWPEES